MALKQNHCSLSMSVCAIKFKPLLDWSPYEFDPKVYLLACQLPLFTGHRRLYVHNISISVLKSHDNRSENFRERNHSLVAEDRLISKSTR